MKKKKKKKKKKKMSIKPPTDIINPVPVPRLQVSVTP